jgi:hypothetical protein
MPQKREIRQFAVVAARLASSWGCMRRAEGAIRLRMIPESPLDDARTAAHAWARYKRLMRWMVLVTVAMVAATMYLLYRSNGLVSVHFYIATGLGIAVAMLLMSALMGLVFLSSGTGHDDAIINPLEDEPDR